MKSRSGINSTASFECLLADHTERLAPLSVSKPRKKSEVQKPTDPNKDKELEDYLEKNKDKIQDILQESNKDASTDGTNNGDEDKTEVINPNASKSLKADGNASIEDFIEMVGMVIAKTTDEDIEFCFNEGDRIKRDPDVDINKTFIRYNILSRTPERELKPVPREEYIAEKGVPKSERRVLSVRAQRFRSIIQFDVFAADYKHATKAMNELEDAIFSYMHYFKRNGVGEIIFKQQLTDTALDTYRENFSIKSLQYQVVTEKQFVIFDGIIDDLEIATT